MSQRNIINSNFWQIANADANTGNITGIKTANFSANGAEVNLGSVSNLRIAGGQPGQVLTTNGNGTVRWATGGGGGGGGANVQPAIEFTVATTGENQSFTDPAIFNLGGNYIAPVYVNGVLLLTTDFEINGDTLTVYGDLNAGDVVTAASTTVSTVTPQSYIASGNSSIVITPNAQITMSSNGVSNIVSIANNTLTTTNFRVSNRANLGPVGNITITGGASGQVLTTDGAGNLAWVTGGGGGGGSLANGTTSIDINSTNIALNVSGNLITTVAANGQTTTGNITASGNITANGNIQASTVNANSVTSNTLTANRLVTANISSNANIVLTSNGNATLSVSNVNVTVTGNVVTSGTSTSNASIANTTTTYGNTTTGNLSITAGGTLTTAAIASGTSNIRMPTSGNVSVSSGGNANVLVVSPAGITVSGTTTLGNANTVSIGGGTNGQYLKTDGAGNLSWGTISGSGTLANGNSSVDVTDAGVTISANNTANVLSVTSTGIKVTGEANLGPVTGVTITGGSSGQVLRTSGSGGLSWVDLAKLANGTSNVNVAENGNITVSSAGNAGILTITGTGVNVGGNSNISGDVAVGGNLKVTGNVQSSLIPATNITYDLGNANYRWGDLYLSNNTIYLGNATIKSQNSTVMLQGLSITANGNIDSNNTPSSGGVYIESNLDVGNVLTAGSANLGTVTVADLSVTGNIAISSISNGTSNVVTEQDANVTISTNGVGEVVTVSGNLNRVNYTSTAIVAPGANVIPLNTVTGLAIGKVLNAPTFLTPGTTVTAINSLNVTVSAATILEAPSGTTFFTTAPTSLVKIADALTVTGKSNLNAVGNVIITGGSNGQFLKTDGAGNLSWTAPVATGLANGNSNVIVTANGNITMYVAGNANARFTVTSTGANITGGANITLGLAVGAAATIGGNLSVTGNLTVTANATMSSLLTVANVANFRLANGSNGQVLQTDGNSNLTWVTPTAVSIANGNSTLTIVNSNGAAAANGNFVFRVNNVSSRMTVAERSVAILGNLTVNNDASGGGNITISNNLSVTGNTTLTGVVTLSTVSVASYSGSPTVKIAAKVFYNQTSDFGNFRIAAGDNSFYLYQPSFQSISGSRTIIGSVTTINANGIAKTQLFSRALNTTSYLPAADTANCNMSAVGATQVVDFVDMSSGQAYRFTAIVADTTASSTTGYTMMTLERTL